MAYRAFGLKQMQYNNGRTLSLQYDNRMRVSQWNIPGVMGMELLLPVLWREHWTCDLRAEHY
jgi:hypothetical protein